MLPDHVQSLGIDQTPLVALTSVPPASADVDLLDPEALLAFFQHQMGDVRAKLGQLMNDQETKNARANKLQGLEAQLVQFQESGVKPGDPGWDGFVDTATAMKALLGDSKEGQSIQALLDKASAPTSNVQAFFDRGAAKEAAKKAGTDFVDGSPHDAAGTHIYWVDTKDGPGPGLGKEDVASILASSRSIRDGIQSDSALNMIRVQQLVESSSQIVNLCSNIMKKIGDSQMAAINNLR